MTDETDLNWKTRGLKAWLWLQAHPVVFAAGAGFLAGALLPRVVGWFL